VAAARNTAPVLLLFHGFQHLRQKIMILYRYRLFLFSFFFWIIKYASRPRSFSRHPQPTRLFLTNPVKKK
jgi:hypothetical protein